MDPPAAIPAEFTAGTATESHLTGRLLRSHDQGIMPLQLTRLCSGLSMSEAKLMRTVVFSTAVIAGVVWIGMVPANAAPLNVRNRRYKY